MRDTENKRDFFVKITTIQLMLFAAVLLACFLLGRYMPEQSERWKSDYAKWTARDMTYEDWKALFQRQEEEYTEEKEPEAETTIPAEPGTTQPRTVSAAENITGPEYSLGAVRTASAGYLSKQIASSPVFPVSGSVSSSFGSRISPIYQYSEEHKGVDIAARQGTPIRAVMDGIVSMVDYTPGRGNFLILEHKDTEEECVQTLYQHCEKILVKTGTVVRAGEIIALVGSTGDSTGPHLHLEYRVNGECLDPIRELFGDSDAV